MIYLIGGPARAGKSTLAKMVRKEIDGQVLAGDAFVRSLRDNMEDQWIPDLFEHHNDPIEKHFPADAKIKRLRRRDKVSWQFYKAYLMAAAVGAAGDDVLIEGNIWPDFLPEFDLPHRAVFLIDTSPDQAVRLRKIRDSDSDNNWMRDFSDEKMDEWAMFNVVRSQRYIEYCQKHGFTYFDIADHGIEKAQLLAFEHLLHKKV